MLQVAGWAAQGVPLARGVNLADIASVFDLDEFAVEDAIPALALSLALTLLLWGATALRRTSRVSGAMAPITHAIIAAPSASPITSCATDPSPAP